MIYDKDFLLKLDSQRDKTLYGKITLLRADEMPIRQLEGVLSQGSVNVDGKSSVRRTCSLTMVSTEVNFSDYLWALTSKFKLEVGVKNNIDKRYAPIIWFPQGIFLLTSFNSSLSINSYTINLQGKDKMCQLNGENGGTFQSVVDLGRYQEIDEYNNIEYKSMLIKSIISDMVHTYGGEPIHNIIINDLDDLGLQVQTWSSDQPLYLMRKKGFPVGEYEKANIGGNLEIVFNGRKTTLNSLSNYDSLTGIKNDSPIFEYKGDQWHAAKFVYGDAVGYTETDLTFPGELIANPGDTVTSILDKIINNFSDFEYFYNLSGQFVFQKKENYLNTAFAPDIFYDENGGYAVEPYFMASDTIYEFKGAELITAFNNTPNLTDLKNDYSIWGKRGDSKTIPIHLRYAIDKKPVKYTSITVDDSELIEYNKKHNFTLMGQNGVTYRALKTDETIDLPELNVYGSASGSSLKVTADSVKESENGLALINAVATVNDEIRCDWRELIYRMALDYRKYGHLDDFKLKVARANPELYSTGRTGYEQYYIDLEGFWRDLYNPEPVYEKINYIQENHSYYKKTEKGVPLTQVNRNNGTKVYYNKRKLREKPEYAVARMGPDNKWYDKSGSEIQRNNLFIKNTDYTHIYIDKNIFHVKTLETNLYVMKEISAEDAYRSGQTAYIKVKIDSEDQQHSWPLYQIKQKTTEEGFQNNIFELIPTYSTKNIDGGDINSSTSASLNLYDIVPATEKQLEDKDMIFYTKEPYYQFTLESPVGYGDKICELVPSERGLYSNTPWYYFNENDGFYYEAVNVNKNDFPKTTFYEFREVELYSLNKDYYSVNDQYAYWHKNIIEAPELLNFWFDLLDTQTEVNRYSVSNIGVRPKVVNNDKVSAISYNKIPLCIFYDGDDNRGGKPGYYYIDLHSEKLNSTIGAVSIIMDQNGVLKADDANIKVSLGSYGISSMSLKDPVDNQEYYYWRYEQYTNMNGLLSEGWRGSDNHPIKYLFSSTGRGLAAQDEINTLLYTHSYMLEAVSLTTIPIYHLEPNKRVNIFNKDAGIEGDYLLTSYSVPLAYNGTMNLSATKIYNRII